MFNAADNIRATLEEREVYMKGQLKEAHFFDVSAARYAALACCFRSPVLRLSFVRRAIVWFSIPISISDCCRRRPCLSYVAP